MCAIKFQNQLLGIQTELMRFAIKLTCDVEEAHDLLQETFLKALDNESKFADDTNFRGWMYTIMRNIFINNYRRYTRDRTYVDRSENQYQINTPRDLCSRVTEENYDLKEIRLVLNRLPTEYRVPFSMHVAGFKYREIADRLDLPLGTVKSRIFFTRQRLQVQLVDFL